MGTDIEFVDGLIVKPPNENAPEYVIAKISIKREELIAWLQKKEGEWINLDVKESQAGKYYASVDNWKPNGNRQESSKPRQESKPAQAQTGFADDFADDDIPF